MALQEKMIKKGKIYKRAVVDVPTEDYSKKGRIRKDIEGEVFDLADSVADNAKIISLLMSIILRMYGTYTDTQKNRLNAADRALIESAFAAFSATPTRADVAIAEEGVESVIARLLDRQKQVADIINRHK